MKLVYFLFGMIVIATSCKTKSNVEKNENGIIFQTYFIGNSIYICQNSSDRFFIIESKLINNTNKDYEFVAYSCATVGNIVINHRCIEPCISECSHNYPTVIKLEPKQEFSMPFVLKISNCDLSEQDSVRIGFVIINPNELLDISEFGVFLERSRTSFEHILWSEPLSCGDKPFEIRNSNDIQPINK